MNRTIAKVLTVILSVATCICTMSNTVSASPQDKHYTGVAPIDSFPLGKTYEDWAAEWRIWSLGTPTIDPNATKISPYNPVLGGPCEIGQSGDSKVWFLAGANGNTTGTVFRTCTVPKDTSLFFPLINWGYVAFLNDHPDNRLLSLVRSWSRCAVPGDPVTFASVTVDGIAVKNPSKYYVESSFYELKMPVDNLYGIKGTADPSFPPDPTSPNSIAYNLWASPGSDTGYYLFLNPLKPGIHTIEWDVVWPSCGVQNIHYDITVPHH
jgi:hypothetical protein